MMQHSNGPQHLYSLIPYSVLQGDDYTPLVRPDLSRREPSARQGRPLHHHRGVIGLDEYNSSRAKSAPGARTEIPLSVRDLGKISRRRAARR